MLRAMGVSAGGSERGKHEKHRSVLWYTRWRACAMPRLVLRSGPDGADRVDGAGGAVAVPSGAVAVQVAVALQVDEVAPAGVAADPAVDVAAHVTPAVDLTASPALRVLRAAHGEEPCGVAHVDVLVRGAVAVAAARVGRHRHAKQHSTLVQIPFFNTLRSINRK